MFWKRSLDIFDRCLKSESEGVGKFQSYKSITRKWFTLRITSTKRILDHRRANTTVSSKCTKFDLEVKIISRGMRSVALFLCLYYCFSCITLVATSISVDWLKSIVTKSYSAEIVARFLSSFEHVWLAKACIYFKIIHFMKHD